MKCLNCGEDFTNPRWPSSWRARLRLYKRTGQIPGWKFGAFTCSVRCNHVIATLRENSAVREMKRLLGW